MQTNDDAKLVLGILRSTQVDSVAFVILGAMHNDGILVDRRGLRDSQLPLQVRETPLLRSVNYPELRLTFSFLWSPENLTDSIYFAIFIVTIYTSPVPRE